MADAPDLQRLLQDKHEALRAYRAAEDDDARKIAWDGVDTASRALDAAIVDREESREDNERIAAVEAREAAARTVAEVQAAPKPIISRDSIGDFLAQRTNTVNFAIPLEQRTDITSAASGAYGSYLPGQEWTTKLDKFLVAQSGVIAAGPHILRTATGNQINWLTLATDATANAGTEGTAATVTNPVFGTVPLNAWRVDVYMAISDELLADASVNLEAELSDIAMRAIAIKCAPYYNDTDIGTGSSLPAAVAIGSTAGKTAAGVDTVTLDELKELFYSVLPGYRANGSWVFNSDLYLETMLMKNDQGDYMVQPSVMAAEPDRLFGKPMYEDAYADASATGNVGCVLFGDFDQGYLVRFARGIEVGLSREFAFTSFETTMRAAIWHDAATIDTLAVKHLVLA